MSIKMAQSHWESDGLDFEGNLKGAIFPACLPCGGSVPLPYRHSAVSWGLQPCGWPPYPAGPEYRCPYVARQPVL